MKNKTLKHYKRKNCLAAVATAATRPLKLKKLSFRSCKRLREMVYYQ